jgi:pSer/pThr/pTyr-binding forkhead associated (FHA) protein
MCASNFAIVRMVALAGMPPFHVGRIPVVIGRHPQCDVRIDSIQISRYHCCLTEIDGEVWVRDLGSTNGVRINGRRVESGRLKLGDELSLAEFHFYVEVGGSAALRVS